MFLFFARHQLSLKCGTISNSVVFLIFSARTRCAPPERRARIPSRVAKEEEGRGSMATYSRPIMKMVFSPCLGEILGGDLDCIQYTSVDSRLSWGEGEIQSRFYITVLQIVLSVHLISFLLA